MPNSIAPDLQSLVEEAEKERAQVESEAREIDSLVKQTSVEVDRLQQRQSDVAQRVRQVEANLEAYPREEIKSTFAAAQDAQMRLFMMRSQLEQLQNKQRALQRYRGQLDRFMLRANQLRELSHSPSAGSSPEHGIDRQAIIQIIEAQEMERQYLARQMHDGPAQSLTNLILQAEIVERLFDSDVNNARMELVNLKAAANATFQRIRDFIFDLRPMMLDDLGLAPTLKRYTQTFESKSHLATQLTTRGERALPSYTEVAIFRSIQELLNNIVRYAHASHAQLTLDLQRNPVVVTLEHDGSGFVPEPTAGAQPNSDLANLEKRIQMLGGKIQFESGASRGNKVRIEFPAAA